MGILTDSNGFTPVTPDPPGTTDVVVVGPDPAGVAAAAIHPQLEAVGGDSQHLEGKQFVLLDIDTVPAIQKNPPNFMFLLFLLTASSSALEVRAPFLQLRFYRCNFSQHTNSPGKIPGKCLIFFHSSSRFSTQHFQDGKKTVLSPGA